jgi:protein SCO1/2
MANVFRRLTLVAAATFLLMALVGCQGASHGTVLDPPLEIGTYDLDRADGGTYQLGEQDGLMLVYFGYTYCPDVCPTTMLELRKAYEALGDRGADVQVMMVTVDPARDTADKLARYVSNFNPAFIGLRTDDEAELDALLADFGAYRELETPSADDPGNYLVSHTATVYLVDGSNVREIFSYGTPGADIAADVKRELRGQ